MKSKIEIEEILYVKETAVHGQMGRLTLEQEHDLKVQIDVLKWVLSLSKTQANPKDLSANKDFTASPKVCPRNHSIVRQLTEDGYCMDCGGYPLREGKPS